MRWFGWVMLLMMTKFSVSSNVLMLTIGGTKSHKIPFLAIAKELIARNNSVTFISPFVTPDIGMPGLEEINPASLVFYVKNYTDWDLVGARMKGEEPVPIFDVIRYAFEVCQALYDDHETQEFLYSGRKFDLFILDSSFPECAMGIVHVLKLPFVYLNTVAFYTNPLSKIGNPAPYAVTPFLAQPFTDDMDFGQRIKNAMLAILVDLMDRVAIRKLDPIFQKHFPNMVDSREMIKNVSFIFQNGHYSVTYPRPLLPIIAEIGCIQCRPPKPLRKDLEDFINLGGDKGFIFVSMGSSVKTANMPEELRLLFIRTLARLPYQILWKWDTENIKDLPNNVMVSKWLPQQDLLGHKKIRAFVTHSGLLSTVETVYHAVPVVTMPVFCDQESNAAKAVQDGYAEKLSFVDLTSDILYNAIIKVASEPKYKENAKRRQRMLKDDINTPMEKAMYWIEYVLRHKGDAGFSTPARNLNFLQYYSLDVFAFLGVCLLTALWLVKWFTKSLFRFFVESSTNKYKHD